MEPKASLIISFGLQIFITILVGREAEIKKPVYTTFYFAGIANFLLLYGREEGIKPSPAAAIVWWSWSIQTCVMHGGEYWTRCMVKIMLAKTI
jgi:hypothetical protein